MKPLEYLKFKKEDILFNLTNQNNYTIEKADRIYQTLHDLVQKLTSVRNSESLTHKILTELDCMPELDMRTIKHWLIESFSSDNTFIYAHNLLAKFWNNDPGAFSLYKIKYLPDKYLYALMESEKQAQKNIAQSEELANYFKGLRQINDKVKLTAEVKPTSEVKLTRDELKKLKENLEDNINFRSISKFSETIDALNNSGMLLGNKNIEFAAVAIILHKGFCKKSIEFNYWLSTFATELHRDFTNYKPANPQLIQKRDKVLIKCPYLDNLS